MIEHNRFFRPMTESEKKKNDFMRGLLHNVTYPYPLICPRRTLLSLCVSAVINKTPQPSMCANLFAIERSDVKV